MILTPDEKLILLDAIQEARRRVLAYEGELSPFEARNILRDTIGTPLNNILRNHNGVEDNKNEIL